VLSVSQRDDGVSFDIHVTPRSSRARVGGTHGDALRVSVTQPPVDGAANAACVASLARALGVPRHQVALDAGARGRRKQVRVSGDATALIRRLRELASSPEPG
jgi:uncharacterized protein (TIGR00251 family)